MTDAILQTINVPSRSAVKRAGDVLRSDHASLEEWENAVQMLSVWRSLHYYPINTFQAYLRTKVKRDKLSGAIIAQRLKRMPSIVTKLRRFENMQLDRMQDIGGIRIILDNVQTVNNFHKDLLKAQLAHKPVLPPKDYIQKPKPDGYRSIHQVFRYGNKNHPELNVLHVELQLRTKLQHSWATAVETLGIIEKSSFKTGEGDEKFKTFFKLSSALLSMEENQPVLEEYSEISRQELISRLNTIENELNITSKLKGLAISAEHIESNGKSEGYHVMELDLNKERVYLTAFNQLDDAETFYTAKEKKTHNNPNVSIVLMSAGGIKIIKKAYPNYFLDTNDFIRRLKRIMNE